MIDQTNNSIKGNTEIYNESSASYTLALRDRTSILERENAAANTTSIPLDATTAFPIGTIITVVEFGAGAVTLTAVAGVLLNGTDGGSVVIGVKYEAIALYKRGTDDWVAINK